MAKKEYQMKRRNTLATDNDGNPIYAGDKVEMTMKTGEVARGTVFYSSSFAQYEVKDDDGLRGTLSLAFWLLGRYEKENAYNTIKVVGHVDNYTEFNDKCNEYEKLRIEDEF